MGKINVYGKIVIEEQKRENMEIKESLKKSPSKSLYMNEIHGLQRRVDARGSADIIYSCDAYC